MKGYFISQEKAIELGLLENPAISANLQKVIIAITEKDVIEHQVANENKAFALTDKKIEEVSNWFYKNYYEAFLENNFKE
jgi:hypothetical protein